MSFFLHSFSSISPPGPPIPAPAKNAPARICSGADRRKTCLCRRHPWQGPDGPHPVRRPWQKTPTENWRKAQKPRRGSDHCSVDQRRLNACTFSSGCPADRPPSRCRRRPPPCRCCRPQSSGRRRSRRYCAPAAAKSPRRPPLYPPGPGV